MKQRSVVLICAIILAAGESRRMGELKPLIKINGKTFLQHIAGQIRKAGIEEILVVAGYNPQKIIAESGLDSVEFVVNKNYQNGQFSSLQTGIGNLPEQCEGAVVCLGDQPQIKAEWIEQIIAAARASNAPVVTPKFKTRRGHPIYFAASLFEEILAMSPTQTAHDLIQNHQNEIVDVSIHDDAIHVDADTPQDLQKVKAYFKK